MKAKRLFVGLSALALAAAMAPMSAFAATIDQETNPNLPNSPTDESIRVSFQNAPTYSVIIPADVSFTGADEKPENEVAVSDVYLDKGKSVKVTVRSVNNYFPETKTPGGRNICRSARVFVMRELLFVFLSDVLRNADREARGRNYHSRP